MNELYEALGRKQAALDAMNVEYDRLLSLLQQVVSGKISPGRVTVDTEKRTWACKPEEVPDAGG